MLRSALPFLALVSSISLAVGAPVHPKSTPRGTPKPKATPAPAAAAMGDGAAPEAAGTAAPENAAPTAIKLVICSDSTAANFDEAGEYHGWGEFLQAHFTDAVQVTNSAKKGRTARSFIDQGAWKDVLKNKPNVVLIQFGHNELMAALNSGDMTAALREYRKYLGAYVDTAKRAGAEPIVLSPTHHMAFDPDGKPKDALTPFVEAAQQLADNRGVPFIDIHSACERIYEALGAGKTKQFQGRPEDPVHFGRLGAWTVAAVVAKELALVDKRLAAAEKPAPSPIASSSDQ